MLFDKSLMKKSKSVKSACGKKKSVKAAVDGGWEVPDHLAHEAYDLAEEYFGTDDINQQIVDALSDTELAENLAFIFRMNDFREWDDYLEENYPEDEDDEDDDDIEESVRAKRKRAVKASKSIKASVESGYTEDLSDFGMREIELLRDILDAWLNNGLPDDFEYSGVKPAFNTRSGYVFLVNDEYQVAMEVDGVLESFYTTPYEGYEGFYEELLDEADNSWNYEDLEYLRDIAENRGDSDGADKLTALMAEDSDGDIEESVRAKHKRAVRASKKSVKRFKVNASTGKVSYKRRNKVTAAEGKADSYTLVDYFDVWGNEEDGWEVNNLARYEDFINITDDATDADIIQGLINAGYLSSDAVSKISVEDSGDGFIELFVTETGEPVCRLENERTFGVGASTNSKK